MEIEIKWLRPLPLWDSSRENLIYSTNLDRVPEYAGVYFFAREHGDTAEVLYVGKAVNLRRRLTQQLNNARLMTGIKKARTGRRVFVCGEILTKRGQQLARVLQIAESALIRRFIAEGHDLLNYSGTVIRSHKILSDRLVYCRIIPKEMHFEI